MGIFIDRYGDLRVIWTVIFVVVGVGLFVGGLVGAAYGIDKYSCSKLSENTGIETKYRFMGGGCLVKVNNRFIPKENWRGEYQQ